MEEYIVDKTQIICVLTKMDILKPYKLVFLMIINIVTIVLNKIIRNVFLQMIT